MCMYGTQVSETEVNVTVFVYCFLQSRLCSKNMEKRRILWNVQRCVNNIVKRLMPLNLPKRCFQRFLSNLLSHVILWVSNIFRSSFPLVFLMPITRTKPLCIVTYRMYNNRESSADYSFLIPCNRVRKWL